MSGQKVNLQAGVNTVALTPLARFARSVLQILIAVGAAIPIILNTPAVAGNAVVAKDLGIAAGLIASVVAIWNSLENYGIIPVIGGTPASTIVPTITASNIQPPKPLDVPSL